MIKINDILIKDSLDIIRKITTKSYLKKMIIELSFYIVLGLLLIFLFDNNWFGILIIAYGLFEAIKKYFSIKQASKTTPPIVYANIEEEIIIDDRQIFINQKNGDGYADSEKILYSFISNVQKTEGLYFIYMKTGRFFVTSAKNITEGSEEELDAIFTNVLGPRFIKK